jgi:dienelactone hydrolase
MRRTTAILCLLVAQAAHGAVEIVAPSEVLHDADVAARVTGLEPGAAVDVQSDFVTHGGTIWRSMSTLTADATGAADVPKSFLWSMEKTKEIPSTTSTLENEDRSIVTVTVLQQGKKLAEKRITLWKRAPGVLTAEIREPGVVGMFYAPYGKRALPGVIVLGGSEGGISREPAALLASHGYAALAVAYFGIAPLPEDLDRIPIETIDRAVAWLRAQPSVDAKRIAIWGGSKGAELALLAASHNPAIRAVVAVAPSSVVYQSITGGKQESSSWTAGEQELPYARYVSSEEFKKSKRLIDLYVPTLAAATAEAAIPVETINGPILLLAGKEDALWPSAEMAAQIEARAKRLGFRYPVINRAFDAAGHHVGRPPNRPTADSVRLGGTAEGIAAAQRESWRAMLEFLDRSLRP